MTLRLLLRSSAVCAVIVAAVFALAPVAAAQSDAGSDAAARALFTEARAAYAAQRFEDAARAFRRAYLLSPRYPLLYNIGQSELRAGHDALALEAFEAFLRQAPRDNPSRSEVEERAQILRSMGVTAAPATTAITPQPTTTASTPAPEPTTTPVPEPTTTVVTPPVVRETREANPPVEPPIMQDTPPVVSEPPAVDVSEPRTEGEPGAAPWIIFGGGAAALVTGVVLMAVGASSAADVTGAPDGSRWSELESVASGASTMWGVGMVLAGVGLAAGSVGLVWALSGSSSSSRGEATARLRVGPMGLALEGEF